MTHVDTVYQMMRPSGGSILGELYYESIEKAIEGTEYQVNRAKENGYHNDEKWLIVMITTATITDNNGNFVSQTVDKKAIGIYDNGNVTMY